MNVALPSIAVAQPPSSPSLPSVQGASDDGSAPSFAGAMQAMQTISGPPAATEQISAPQPSSDSDKQNLPASLDADGKSSAAADAVNAKALPKALSADSTKFTGKTMHPHGSALATLSAKPVAHTSSKPVLPKSHEAAPGQVPAESTDQNAAATAVALIGARPAAAETSSADAVTAASGSSPALQKGKDASTAKSSDATPQMTQSGSAVASVSDSGAVTPTAAAQNSSPDTSEEPVFADNVFCGVTVTAAMETQPAAVFTPFLATQASSTNEHRVSTDLSGTRGSNSVITTTGDVAEPQAAPVRRLEIAMHDPILGNVDVRAEMRGGALHATVIGSQDSAAAGMPALHQFLQGHDVNLHSLTYATARDGVTATASTTFKGSDMSRDTAGGSFSGGAGSRSQSSEGGGSQHQQPYRSSGTGYDENLFAPAYATQPYGIPSAMAANSMLSTGSTLSIHI